MAKRAPKKPKREPKWRMVERVAALVENALRVPAQERPCCREIRCACLRQARSDSPPTQPTILARRAVDLLNTLVKSTIQGLTSLERWLAASSEALTGAERGVSRSMQRVDSTDRALERPNFMAMTLMDAPAPARQALAPACREVDTPAQHDEPTAQAFASAIFLLIPLARAVAPQTNVLATSAQVVAPMNSVLIPLAQAVAPQANVLATSAQVVAPTNSVLIPLAQAVGSVLIRRF